uniref:Lanosterol synthase n=1 Tax=Prochloron didemni P2-Fiji TaxID=910454 RepID=G0XS44_PRODI|nr:lanosterol synthase [Prochloron didemni P2-Fiji]
MSIKSDRAKFQQSMFDENDILNTHDVLDAGIRFLLSNQAADGSWEGEVIWCPVLTAQYTIMCYIVGLCIHKKRREAILRQFQSTRLPNGLWGLHEKAEPSLFVTTLVYVSSRILGIGKDEELLINAFEFIRNLGGVTSIPSWGKFWLSMLNLYKWNGCNPVLPETWALPKCFFSTLRTIIAIPEQSIWVWHISMVKNFKFQFLLSSKLYVLSYMRLNIN